MRKEQKKNENYTLSTQDCKNNRQCLSTNNFLGVLHEEKEKHSGKATTIRL
jgi:hypothetical protein